MHKEQRQISNLGISSLSTVTLKGIFTLYNVYYFSSALYSAQIEIMTITKLVIKHL